MMTQKTSQSIGPKNIPTPNNEPLWTVDDLADYLQLKTETVRMMARAQKIPAIKVGRVWRFKASEIKEMLGSKADK